ncbi:hypothetical protein [Bacillus wiedmannii]|nr:hypothetical protein [Bacillus wiedmannii]
MAKDRNVFVFYMKQRINPVSLSIFNRLLNYGGGNLIQSFTMLD